jgi:hypothetical protein
MYIMGFVGEARRGEDGQSLFERSHRRWVTVPSRSLAVADAERSLPGDQLGQKSWTWEYSYK